MSKGGGEAIFISFVPSLLYSRLDLTPLGSMRNLIYIDVSHNNLTTLLDFQPPLALRVNNFLLIDYCIINNSLHRNDLLTDHLTYRHIFRKQRSDMYKLINFTN